MSSSPRLCRCTARLTALGACPYNCPPRTYLDTAKELEIKLRAREQKAIAPIGLSKEAASAGAKRAGVIVEKWRNLPFSGNAPRRKT